MSDRAIRIRLERIKNLLDGLIETMDDQELSDSTTINHLTTAYAELLAARKAHRAHIVRTTEV